MKMNKNLLILSIVLLLSLSFVSATNYNTDFSTDDWTDVNEGGSGIVEINTGTETLDAVVGRSTKEVSYYEITSSADDWTIQTKLTLDEAQTGNHLFWAIADTTPTGDASNTGVWSDNLFGFWLSGGGSTYWNGTQEDNAYIAWVEYDSSVQNVADKLTASDTPMIFDDHTYLFQIKKDGTDVTYVVMDYADDSILINKTITTSITETLTYITTTGFDTDTGSVPISYTMTTTQEWLNYTDVYGASAVDKFAVTALNFWDDNSVIGFWADIDGTNYTTTNGTINTDLYENNTGTYTLKVGAVDYFSETYSLGVDSAFEAVLHQSEVDFETFDLVTGLSIDSSFAPDYTVDGQVNTTFYLGEANDYVVLVEPSDDYRPLNYTFNVTALDVKTENVLGVYNASINFNITDVVTGAVVDVGTSIYLNYTSSDWADSFDSVNGLVTGINLSQLNYTALIIADGYAPRSVNISVNNSTQVFSYSLYSNNSVWITAVDFDSALDLTNFSVTVSNVNDTYSGSDGGTGIVRINDVAGGVYTVRVTKSGYAVGEYALLMTGGSHQNVIAYLSSAGSTTIFTIVDSISGQIIEGATGNMYKSINSSYTLVSSQSSDITGRIQYSYTPDIEYKFVMDHADYEQRSFFLKPLFGSYTIRLTPGLVSIPDLNTGDYVFEINNSGLFYDALNNSFEISISSGTGTIEYYNLTVTNFDGTPVLDNCAVAQGCSDSFVFEIVGASFEDVIAVEYRIKESGRSEKYFKKVYHVQDIYDPSTLEGWKDVDDADVDSLSKAFIAMIVCLIVVGFVSLGSIMVGVPPVTASGFVLALLVEVFAYVGFIPNLAGHLVALGCILIVVFGRGEI